MGDLLKGVGGACSTPLHYLSLAGGMPLVTVLVPVIGGVVSGSV